jgi:hypothetical protein
MIAEQQRQRRDLRELYEVRDRSPEDRQRRHEAAVVIGRRERADEWSVNGLGVRAAAGDREAISKALELLEADPRYFRSG